MNVFGENIEKMFACSSVIILEGRNLGLRKIIEIQSKIETRERELYAKLYMTQYEKRSITKFSTLSVL